MTTSVLFHSRPAAEACAGEHGVIHVIDDRLGNIVGYRVEIERQRAEIADPYALETVWCNALGAFPDRKPLAQIMRDRTTPMTFGTRDLLAEMLGPGDPPITDYQLVPRHIKRFGETLDRPLEIASAYGKERDAGRPAQDAAAETSEKYRITDRTVFRHVETLRRLAGRLRGAK